MTVRTDDRKQFLLDVFTTALEGGIGYWSEAEAYHWENADETPDLDGFYARILDLQQGDKDNEPYRIDAAVIAKGIGLFEQYALGKISGLGDPVADHAQEPVGESHYWRQFLLANRTNGEDGDYDSDVADMIVQFGLFGAVLYS